MRARSQERLLIIGNVGAGKSWLARRLSARLGIPRTPMDRFNWEPGGHYVQRPKAAVLAEVLAVAEQDRWILEGVYGWIAAALAPRASCLLWLDLSWTDCRRGLMERGPENVGQIGLAAAERQLAELVAWAEGYPERDDETSRKGHGRIFEGFGGLKRRFSERDEVVAWLESLDDAAASGAKDRASQA